MVVAFEPLETAAAVDAERARAELALFIAALLEADPGAPLEVRDAVLWQVGVLRAALSGVARSDPREALLAAARRAGGEVAIHAALTRLAGGQSLDVRALDVRTGTTLYHAVFDGPEAIGRAAAAVGRALGGLRGALRGAPRTGPARAPQAEVGSEAEALPAPPPPARVGEIRIQGNRRIEGDAIRAVLATQVGDPPDARVLGEDVRRIYELGFFRDVRVAANPGPRGPILTFYVEENPIIRQVSVSGNESLGADDIKEILTVTVGSTVDYPLLFENQARIEALYKSRGYYLVRTGYTVEAMGEAAVAINFEIAEGRKLRLVEIDFSGNEHFSDGELRSLIDTKPWGWMSYATQYWTKTGLYTEPIFHQDLNRVARKYMDAGFIRVRVGEPEVEHDERGLRVAVSIDEGNAYAVGSIDVLGDETLALDELRDLVRLEQGETFNRSVLSDDVERLQGYYADQGYYFAKVTPRTRVDADERVVDCAFEVEKGDLFFVDRIEVRGNTRTRDEVVRRELSLDEGALYSASALERSRARVRRLGFFEEVEIEPRQVDEPQHLSLDVEVVERPTGTFSFGAGFGSTDGFLLNSALRQDNWFGRGYGLNLVADLGTQNQNAFVRFSNPYLMGTLVSLSTSFRASDTEFGDFDQELLGFDFTLGYPLDEGETRAFGSYSFTSRGITGQDVIAASLVQREEFQDQTTTSLLSFSARRDTRDDPRFPRDGQVSGLALEWAGLGGFSSFLRFEGRTTWWFPVKRWLGFDSTFMINSRFGYALPFNSISDFDLPPCDGCDFTNPAQFRRLEDIDDELKLPLTERYFIGGLGAFQVRGFRQRTLGPRRTGLDQAGAPGPNRLFFPIGYNPSDPNRACTRPANDCNDLDDSDIDDFENLDLADVIGGNKMFLLNLELQFPISEDLGLQGMVFLDMGNAFAENESINPADFRFGTGVGAQWFSPFGPIVVYLGFPLDALEDEDGSVFEFSLGGAGF